ncbi:hypothetical protein N0V95_000892 [Ascochyta clinopodiicola]|nr:hypothetical protein N0V95_000892 [Ascochyta clinopodiicola]
MSTEIAFRFLDLPKELRLMAYERLPSYRIRKKLPIYNSSGAIQDGKGPTALIKTGYSKVDVDTTSHLTKTLEFFDILKTVLMEGIQNTGGIEEK